MSEESKSVDVEVYVTMYKRGSDGVKRLQRKREVDVGYRGYPVEVFVNGRLIYSTED